MKTIYVILMFVLAFVALFEQSKAQPNMLIMIAAMGAFVYGLMRLMSKVPGKEERDNKSHNSDENV
ncbi:hypothetical protein [uncultured Flavobacterium sp.]|uniref:hypothetical protein n=1 Tax=uncultured Flavobacterium sp. TaxID=165435 RepID=UPI0025CE3548|nr:hypothetical protein [uncultured Flavobacterium sp.]